jgi:hypothetical protein
MLGSEFEICFGRSILCVLLFYGPRLIAANKYRPLLSGLVKQISRDEDIH